MRKDSMRRVGWVMVVAILGILWSVNAYALERRIGSLEFSYTAPPDPIGMVMLNHIADKKPSITYQVPASPGGNFTTPWGILIDGGAIVADTLIMLTNPGDATLGIEVTLRDQEGLIGAGCVKTLTIGANKTQLRAIRTLFLGCPAVTLLTP